VPLVSRGAPDYAPCNRAWPKSHINIPELKMKGPNAVDREVPTEEAIKAIVDSTTLVG